MGPIKQDNVYRKIRKKNYIYINNFEDKAHKRQCNWLFVPHQSWKENESLHKPI